MKKSDWYDVVAKILALVFGLALGAAIVYGVAGIGAIIWSICAIIWSAAS